MNFNWDYVLNSFVAALPGVLGAIILLIIAILVANLLKKAVITGLQKINFSDKLTKWGVSNSQESAHSLVDTLGTLVYFLVIIFFLPMVLSGLNIYGVMDPIMNMFNKFLSFIPNLVGAVLILVIGAYFCKFVKNLVVNLLNGVNVDKWFNKLVGKTEDNAQSTQIAEVVGTVVYVLIFIPLLTMALETLGIHSISAPIVSVLNQVLNAIPNIIFAVIVLLVGGFVAKLVGDLVESLLAASDIDRYSHYLNVKGQATVTISNVVAQIIRAILFVFFFVQALSLLNLSVLNVIGVAIISYIPAVVSALLILAAGVIGGNILATFIQNVSGSKLFATVVRYGLIVLAVFMVLEQLHFAVIIVNTGFILVLGGVSVAFALAFGLGGRDFAAKQLERLDKKIDEETK